MNHTDGVLVRLNNLQFPEEIAVLLHYLECLDVPGSSILEADREHGTCYDVDIAQCNGRKVDTILNFLLLVLGCDLRDVARVNISDDPRDLRLDPSLRASDGIPHDQVLAQSLKKQKRRSH